MSNSRFLNVREVAELLEVSKSTAYKTIRTFNEELKAKGLHTKSGHVERDYFEDKFYRNSKNKRK